VSGVARTSTRAREGKTAAESGMILHRGSLCGGRCQDHRDLAFGGYMRTLFTALPERWAFTLRHEPDDSDPSVRLVYDEAGDCVFARQDETPQAAIGCCHCAIKALVEGWAPGLRRG